ncbi:MAG: GyrI-like domain-containing protein [Clostridia bacterium]|jgi:predicted transcriptional regulator YdeE|nr:GyrI-like domain-containing protein [Clostridia bacterium]
MDYEIVSITEKKVAGISEATNYNSPDAARVIGELWDRFFRDTYNVLVNKVNDKCIGIYTDYSENGDYRTMICAEVKEGSQSIETLTIPAGKYAKFIVKGNIVTAVQKFWQELWNMNLDRAFMCDFEEYQGGEDMDNMEIHIYVSLKD